MDVNHAEMLLRQVETKTALPIGEVEKSLTVDPIRIQTISHESHRYDNNHDESE